VAHRGDTKDEAGAGGEGGGVPSVNHPSTILVIDDNSADIFLLRRGLDQQGEAYQLEILADGPAALQFVDEHRTGAREPNPCVILLDLQLPKYNALKVLRAIKREPVLAQIQVLVLTEFASPIEEANVRSMGAFCRVKPVSPSGYEELAAEVLEICKRSAPEPV
jgi:CheY-like chemotaxis protein